MRHRQAKEAEASEEAAAAMAVVEHAHWEAPLFISLANSCMEPQASVVEGAEAVAPQEEQVRDLPCGGACCAKCSPNP